MTLVMMTMIMMILIKMTLKLAIILTMMRMPKG